MKKILILSYYFPPSNNIGALRAASFAKYFPKFGLEPTVLTRHWAGDEKVWDDYLKADARPTKVTADGCLTLVQVPYSNRVDQLAKRTGKWGYRSYLLSAAAAGTFQPEANADLAFSKEARRLLNDQKFDYILATSPPLNTVRLGSRLSREFGIPVIVDLRDPWSSGILTNDRSYEGKGQKLLCNLQEKYLSGWLCNSSLVTGVSAPITDEVRRIAPLVHTVVVTNGFEAELFEDFDAPNNRKFTVSVVGTLYPQQDLSLMLDGFFDFLKGKDRSRLQFNFIGCAVISEVEALLSRLPSECVRVTKRVPHLEAVSEMRDSDVLFYPGWKGRRGMASGKIFEYLASKRNILIAPSDNDIIERLLLETCAGKTADTIEHLVAILESWFREWEKNGAIAYRGDARKIERYSRIKQAEHFSRKILSINSPLPD